MKPNPLDTTSGRQPEGAIDSGLVKDERGSVGVLFALTCLAVMMFVAVAIDYGRADLEYQRAQRAADAAALAASHRLGLPNQDESGRDVAMRFFAANAKGISKQELQSVTMDGTKGEVRVEAGGSVMSTLLNVFGIRSVDVSVGSRVIKGDGTIEIAMVLDNSGSMGGQPLADLTTAAQNLTNVVFTGASQSDRVKIAVVPFSGAVNVGAANSANSWIDSAGLSPLNGANFATNTPRLQVFDQLGVSWRGCVEARPAPYDTSDDPASEANPQTLFVPMFAPDEPDSNNDGGDRYYNNYLADDGGSCAPQPKECLSYSRRGNCREWYTEPLPPAEAQARMCKYDAASIGTSDGPNYMCTSQPILPLTNSKTEIDSALAMMVAQGYTNIPEGVMWGWRALSPEPPFVDGRPYSNADNKKFLILMTDGANTYPDAANHNRSRYGAHGYGASDRLGTSYRSSGYVSKMNEKLVTACTNAKAAGLKIYTVAFRLDTDPTTTALLRACASEATMAFSAGDGSSLITAFERIGTEISKLRVAG